jgi:hypothetical protein
MQPRGGNLSPARADIQTLLPPSARMHFPLSINALFRLLNPDRQPATLNRVDQTVAAPSRRFTFCIGSAIETR